MCSSFLKSFSACVVLAVSVFASAQAPLRICSDPQNPPFSTRQQRGFENQIAKAIGAELNRPVEFHWMRMGRGFVREVMNKGACDALIAVPVGMRGLLVTAPYYRSTYVFITRRNAQPVSSLDDPRLSKMRIGVQVLEDDYAPPARALARRKLTKNVAGFEMDEDPGAIVSAVAKKKVDVAIVWGPLAGYYAARFGNSLRLTAVTPTLDPPLLPFTYEIAVGVRKSEPQLYREISQAVQRAEPKIQRILRSFNVPTLPMTTAATRNGQ